MNMDEKKNPDKIQTFDSLFTNNHIQMYKILLPYFEPSLQKKLAIYIKYMEFQYTLTYFKHHPYAFMPKNSGFDTVEICREIMPYCANHEKMQLEKIMEMFSNFKSMQEMMDTINMMQEMFPDGFSFGEGDGGGFSPDMMQMFQMFGK